MANQTTTTPTWAYVLAAFVVIVAAFGGYIYLFGIPPEYKRKLEEQALKTMGENKASHMMKDAISNNIPASDQKDVKELQKGLGNALGGGLQNPLGKFAGDAADDSTKGFTGR